MAENKLDDAYWTARYAERRDGWDIGNVSRPLQEYFDQLTQKDLRILIPGCGRGYEGLYLLQLGFKNVYFMDLSATPLEYIQSQAPELPADQLLQANFFEHEEQYDLIIEQTMFCAIDPSFRTDYAKQASRLLKPGGKLVGVMFNRDFEGGPPFGGTKEEYLGYFEPHFKTVEMNECYNSIAPRMGSELFVKMIR